MPLALCWKPGSLVRLQVRSHYLSCPTARHRPLPAFYSAAGSSCLLVNFFFLDERDLCSPTKKKTKRLGRERTLMLCHFCFYWLVDGMGSSKRVNIWYDGPHHEQAGNILIAWYASCLTIRKSCFYSFSL